MTTRRYGRFEEGGIRGGVIGEGEIEERWVFSLTPKEI
jgi:hypothetical protein